MVTVSVLFVVGDGEGDVGIGLEERLVVGFLLVIFVLEEDVEWYFDAFENAFEVLEDEFLVLRTD